MEYIYAALLLHKLGKSVDENNITKIVQAGGASVDESKVKSLVASLKGLDIDAELANAVVVGAAPAAVGAGAEAKPAEEKKEEKKAEESAAGLSALFG
jgi:large subunit ribosomal protein L12